MVVTCGLDHTMSPASDTAEQFHHTHMFETIDYGLHGRVGRPALRAWSGMARRGRATRVCCGLRARCFSPPCSKESLLLRRRIEARVGESRFIENR